MIKRKEFTAKEYIDTSLVYFIISGVMFLGMIIAIFIEGLDKSVIPILLLIITSFMGGVSYRRKGKK
ncbi:hypothetical protein [Cytobacillus sp. IB215665]|uniref:hypothetical protein n=1 Tax=Cytobacillus sp. IB215665 TaxID=3097357 RepID=UPI002A101A7E|nr:hypothetical protein [Cytobacillus sp. IB215665]MDX8367715.1 hypothetical protein [Cytobacillus sp. IB215665]